MRKIGYLAAIAFFSAQTVVAGKPAKTVSLLPGSAVTIAVTPDGDEQVASVEKLETAKLSAADRAVARNFSNGVYDDAVGNNAGTLNSGENGIPELSPVAPNYVRISFVTLNPAKESMLILENGHDKAMVYKAKMTVAGRAQPTDVCLVMPNKRGYEHWPYVIDKLTLSDIELRAWEPEDGVPCE